MKRLAIVLLLALAVVFAGCIQFGPGGNNYQNTTVNTTVDNTTQQNISSNVNTHNETVMNLSWTPASGIESKIQSLLNYLKVLNGASNNATILKAEKERNTGIYRVVLTFDNNTIIEAYLSPDMKKYWLGSDMYQINATDVKGSISSWLKGFRGVTGVSYLSTKKGLFGLPEYDYSVVANGRNYLVPILRVGDRVMMYPSRALKEVFSPNKTDKPQVDLYIMSFCPFGRQAASAMSPVEKALGKVANITVHYVLYPASQYGGQASNFCIDNYCSMHGINETREDVRQLCIQKYYPDKFWDYLDEISSNSTYSPSNIENLWKVAAKKYGIDTQKIEQCFENEGKELLKKEYELDQRYHVTGSPTLLINGSPWNWPRTPSVFQWAICQAFKNQPSECQQSINETVSTAASGSCG